MRAAWQGEPLAPAAALGGSLWGVDYGREDRTSPDYWTGTQPAAAGRWERLAMWGVHDTDVSHAMDSPLRCQKRVS
jgi:hypothetical protein